MKILSLHVDYIKFRPVKKALKEPEKLSEEKKKEKEIKEALVIFTAIEKEDNENSVKDLVKNIKEIASQVKVKSIVLYPYAHLSSNLASPETAIKLLEEAESQLKKEKFKVIRAPFGYYKEFELKCKGHPLAELSREIKSEEVKAKEKKTRKKGSEFIRFILVDKEGKEYIITRENWKESKIWKKKGKEYERLKQFVKNELEGASEKDKPKHITFMRELELVDYCPESDIGHFKWYPKGMLIKQLILDLQEKLAREYGAFKIQNPLLYRLSVPSIRSLLGEFHEKDYSWQESNDTLILRFASDPGAFPYMQKVSFSYKQMPIKEYEEAICFRKEQKGEVKGLRRVRNFLMTDMHAFCKDEKQQKEEFVKLCLLCQNLMDNIIAKGRWVLGWEGTLDYYNKNKKWLLSLIKKMKVPSFFKLMKERSHYYDMKNEYQSIESDGANTQISTVQLDSTNGKRFNIVYTDKDNKKKPCEIIHCSTFGSIERALGAILENAAIDEKEGKKPSLPYWLSPTQVRITPVSEKYINHAVKLAEKLNNENIRTDVDDRDITLPKKISESEKEWIPYVITIGEKELKTKKLAVRVRETRKIENITEKEIIQKLNRKQGDMPWRPLPLPVLLSKRPIFYG